MAKVQVKIFEEEHELELDDTLSSSDVPKAIAQLSLYLAEATYQQRLLEAELREQKATHTAEMLRRDPKLPEWKVRNRWERSEAAQSFYRGLALAERTLGRLEALISGLKARISVPGE